MGARRVAQAYECKQGAALEPLHALRPPLSLERLSRAADGRVVLSLRRPLFDDTAAVAFTPTHAAFETARVLALRGAAVVLACRNPDKGKAALDRVLAGEPKGTATLEALDLADLGSVAAFAELVCVLVRGSNPEVAVS